MSNSRIEQLEQAIRKHRSQLADDRCIDDDDELYAVLGDGVKCDRRVGDKQEMLQNCARFIENRCESGHWPTYQELRADLRQALELIETLNRKYQGGYANYTHYFVLGLRQKNHLAERN